MNATGIVRRIDDLGRVVIPKEIRRNMGIREGDPLEIYTEKDGSVVFKKYSPLCAIESYAKNASDSLIACGVEAAIFDNYGDWISGKKSLMTYKEQLIENLDERNIWTMPNANDVVCHPVISNGDIVGYIIFKCEENSDSAITTVKPIVKMLGYALSH
ncbi:MAG: AbrB/MazE/SpoVT family DNA-binding domain-containing protein [Alphaproteobacteria bacterium]|nr:AbrB/MazE/SpoVT family DNA-binding domain-containing protein [Alphaproteobacteria bacterium]